MDAFSAGWPGVQASRSGEKTAAASDGALADNLPANAADFVKAVHCGRTMGNDRFGVKGLQARFCARGEPFPWAEFGADRPCDSLADASRPPPGPVCRYAHRQERHDPHLTLPRCFANATVEQGTKSRRVWLFCPRHAGA